MAIEHVQPIALENDHQPPNDTELLSKTQMLSNRLSEVSSGLSILRKLNSI